MCAQLRRHPQYAEKWNRSLANKIGRLFLGIGINEDGQHRIKGTNIFLVIHFQDIPKMKINEVCCTSVLFQERPGKSDQNRTCTTICGTNVQYPGYVVTKTASLELLKLINNSVISRLGEKIAALDISNFYLDTPMKKSEYVKIQFSKIPQEFVDEYKLQEYAQNVWLYFECLRGAYGLPKSGILAKNLLRSRL